MTKKQVFLPVIVLFMFMIFVGWSSVSAEEKSMIQKIDETLNLTTVPYAKTTAVKVVKVGEKIIWAGNKKTVEQYYAIVIGKNQINNGTLTRRKSVVYLRGRDGWFEAESKEKVSVEFLPLPFNVKTLQSDLSSVWRVAIYQDEVVFYLNNGVTRHHAKALATKIGTNYRRLKDS